MATHPTLVDQVDKTDVFEFLDALSPWRTLWKPLAGTRDDALGAEWVFRGQGDLRWSLVGHPLRNATEATLSPHIEWRGGTKNPPRTDEITRAELLRIYNFYLGAMQSGLRIPDSAHTYMSGLFERDVVRQAYASQLRHPAMVRHPGPPYDESFARVALENFPEPELWEVMAIARHYGLSVRLLDWTMNPNFAAYFAAKEAARWVYTETKERSPDDPYRAQRPKDAKLIAVWALNASKVDELSRNPEDATGRIVIQWVDVPQWGNSNQIAQQGRFTVVRFVDSPDAKSRPINHTIRGVVDHWSLRSRRTSFEASECVLRAITLPIEKAPMLLRVLANSGVHNATVFPGYGGLVESMNERKLWDKLPDDGHTTA